MEYDRRSNVSSFYGARKSSFDALNPDLHSSSQAQLNQPNDRNRVDSFYDTGAAPSRPGRGYMAGKPSAGYNRMSFIDAGRTEPLKGGLDEEEAASSRGAEPSWDVYADFNNQGPRYSTAFGQRDDGYVLQFVECGLGGLMYDCSGIATARCLRPYLRVRRRRV